MFKTLPVVFVSFSVGVALGMAFGAWALNALGQEVATKFFLGGVAVELVTAMFTLALIRWLKKNQPREY